MEQAAEAERVYPPRENQPAVLNGLATLLRLASYDRLVIAGGPIAGKSTLAGKLGSARVRASDEVKGLGWSEASLAVSYWLDEAGPWVIEGVAMPRALRKWLARNKQGMPADAIVWLGHPVDHRTRGQHVMALGCATVWNEIVPDLRSRGITIIEAEVLQ